ncbi:hypothetical protein Bca52824_056401 [Brassica carinata]|uniref:Uncharacterized protein n=1 Tax=Brassica carinata TaxID=52824 RepID=A0A8X7UF94_BRACI|nr:hypothetical protein Bca52824_056401 [Brassica carinata]
MELVEKVIKRKLYGEEQARSFTRESKFSRKNKSDKKKEGDDDEINSRLSLGTLSFQPNFLYVHLEPEIYLDPKKYEPSRWERSLCRERSCKARDFHFSSSLTTEDGVSYCRFEAVGYDFNTIQLNQLSVAVSAYKPEISVYLEDYGFRERTFESLGEEGRPVMYHTFEKLGK